MSRYVLGPNIKFFAEHGVKGLFEEGDYCSSGSDMDELKSYVISRMQWDPSQVRPPCPVCV